MTSPLDDALRRFETIEANLKKLERLWGEIQDLIPEGVAFLGDGPEGVALEEKQRSWCRLVEAMPSIDGWELPNNLLDHEEISQARLDALELGEVEVQVSTERAILQPGSDLRQYRYLFDGKRRQLIRDRVGILIDEVGRVLNSLKPIAETLEGGSQMPEQEWDELKNLVAQIDTLLGSSVQRPRRWADLRRHLHFGLTGDFDDIAEFDWPSVKSGLETSMYHEDEPLPVDVADLGEVISERPTGPVAVQLNWGRLRPSDFERMIFNLISDAPEYENVGWLTRTNAADRGRDLSATRVRRDSLGGVIRERVIVQCKHLLSSSVRLSDVSEARGQMSLWGPPPIDVLVVVTSGRFTTDAVQFVETQNEARTAPRIEIWPESHLERLLAERPHLIAEFELR